MTKNNPLVNKLKSDSFIKEFPCYGETLVFKINKALGKRLIAVDHSIEVLSKCLSSKSLCQLVLEKTVYYLGSPNLLALE